MERKRPHELSGGMRQRVALVRALAQEASGRVDVDIDIPRPRRIDSPEVSERARWLTDRLQTQRTGANA